MEQMVLTLTQWRTPPNRRPWKPWSRPTVRCLCSSSVSLTPREQRTLSWQTSEWDWAMFWSGSQRPLPWSRWPVPCSGRTWLFIERRSVAQVWTTISSECRENLSWSTHMSVWSTERPRSWFTSETASWSSPRWSRCSFSALLHPVRVCWCSGALGITRSLSSRRWTSWQL